MSILNSEKLSEWEKRPKEYLSEGIDEITRQFIEFCKNNTELDIYYSTRDGRSEHRVIHPKRVLKDYLSGKFYTEAYCCTREEIRVFNLKKITFPKSSDKLLSKLDSNETNTVRPTISCKISETEIENDEGFYIKSVEATCKECGYKTWSYGTALESRKRCLALMNENCKLGANNWYIEQ